MGSTKTFGKQKPSDPKVARQSYRDRWAEKYLKLCINLRHMAAKLVIKVIRGIVHDESRKLDITKVLILQSKIEMSCSQHLPLATLGSSEDLEYAPPFRLKASEHRSCIWLCHQYGQLSFSCYTVLRERRCLTLLGQDAECEQISDCKGTVRFFRCMIFSRSCLISDHRCCKCSAIHAHP